MLSVLEKLVSLEAGKLAPFLFDLDMTNTKNIDCTTCKYGYDDERLNIPMCHHPKRFSEDCVDFNMHEEKEIKESEKPSASNENLNFALDKYIGDLDEKLHKEGCTYEFDWDDITETIREVGSYFAKWQKEQLMSEAVEGKVRNIIIHENGDEVHYSITYPKGRNQYSINDKVKIIIL